MKKYKSKNFYYDNSPVFGIPAIFYILLGGRGCGKTYSTQKYWIKKWLKTGEPFCWLRLKEPSVKKLLANNAKDFIDSDLIRKYNLGEFKVKNNCVYVVDDAENEIEFARIMALSTFYQDKGISMNRKADGTAKNRNLQIHDNALRRVIKPYKTIVLDEMNSERSEKRTFDITYALVNQLENLVRLDTNRRIIMCGNTLEEGSDILSRCFGFIPNEIGIYRLHRKKAVIHYIEDSDEYKKEREKSIAGILTPNESTFTNKVESDVDLIYKGRKKLKPSSIIMFSSTKKYVMCDGVITQMKIPLGYQLPVLALQPYIPGVSYSAEHANAFIKNVQLRAYKFDMLYTLKKFMGDIQSLKN